MAKRDIKPIEKWKSADFWREGSKMAGKNASADERLCAAMMVTALAVGANKGRIAERLGIVDASGFGWMFDNLLKSRVFRKDGKVYANWGDPEDGGMEFTLDIAVGLGLLAKTKAKPKSAKIGANRT